MKQVKEIAMVANVKRLCIIIITVLIFPLFISNIYGQGAGSIDPSFSGITTGFDADVYAIAVQDDGKILVGGNFSNYNGSDCPNYLARLNSDGTLDNTFNNGGSGFNMSVFVISILSNGKILVGGYISSYNGLNCPDMLVRLNSDGSIDNAFNSGGAGFDGQVKCLAVQSDGKIIVGGQFGVYNGLNCPDMLVRLNSDGSLDNTFNSGGDGFNNLIGAISVLDNGKILVGGFFATYNSSACPDCLVRLNSDGSIDNSFNSGGAGFDAYIGGITVLSSSKILVCGDISTYNGSDCSNALVRLNSDGTIDNTFNSSGVGFNAGSYVTSLAIISDNKILAGGGFSSYNGSNCSDNLVRLNSDGTIDNTFNNGGSGFNTSVRSVCIQSDGKILVGGWFGNYNSIDCSDKLVRLYYSYATPTITTNSISAIQANSATCGGSITIDGGPSVTARGVVWSTTTAPTLTTNEAGKTTDGTGTGSFTSSITGLTPNTPYYVRAYATNSAGTAYGSEVSFTTKKIIYVDASKTLGNNNGNDWTNAFTSFQSALNAAVSGDQIWVAKGTYKPSYDYGLGLGTRGNHFRMVAGVEIYGGFAGTETAVSERTDFGDGGENETILSGDLTGDDVVTGSAATLSFSNNTENCYHVFYHPSGLGLTSTAILDGFTIKGGNANGTYPHERGGGIDNYLNSPTIRYCALKNNRANYGGGVFNDYFSSSTLSNCNIYSNIANSSGGGVYNSQSSPTAIINSIISSNSAGNQGGGVYNNQSSPLITSSTISDNSAGNYGGGVRNNDSSPTLNNTIIWGNIAILDGNQFFLSGSSTTLNYSCYSNGTNDVYNDGSGFFTATNNNITTDPLFVNAAGGDYRLLGNSPCVNTGNNTYNSETYDIRGQARIQNTTIDMGAYEWTSGTDKSNPIYVSAGYNSGTSGFGITHYDNLANGIANATSTATINISNYSHTGDINVTGYTYIIGANDFTINGAISGGQIKAISTGKLVQSAVQNTTRTFPLTDGTNNYTVTINPTSESTSGNLSVKLNTGKTMGLVNPMTFWDIYGNNDLNATVTMRLDKAVLGATTIPSNYIIRRWNGTRYVPIPQNTVTITDQDTFYLITITSINQF